MGWKGKAKQAADKVERAIAIGSDRRIQIIIAPLFWNNWSKQESDND